MGLDALELMMEIETGFGVTFREDEWAAWETVGGIVAVLRSRARVRAQENCPSLIAFLRLRALIRRTLSKPTLRIRPRDRWTTLLGPRERRQVWAALPELLGTPVPGLHRPIWLRFDLLMATLALIVLAGRWCLGNPNADVFAVVLMAIIVTSLYVGTLPLRTEPPRRLRTVGCVVAAIVRTRSAGRSFAWASDAEVLAQLRPILARVLNVDEAEITLDARLVEDLGMA